MRTEVKICGGSGAHHLRQRGEGMTPISPHERHVARQIRLHEDLIINVLLTELGRQMQENPNLRKFQYDIPHPFGGGAIRYELLLRTDPVPSCNKPI
jgi:hypothetical protein